MNFEKLLQENEFVLFYDEKNNEYNVLLEHITGDYIEVDLGLSDILKSFFEERYKNKKLPILFYSGVVLDNSKEIEGQIARIFISNLIKKKKYVFIMKGTVEKPYCKYSKELLKICKENDISETEICGFDIFTNDSLRESLKRLNNWSTYPMIYIDGLFIGGLDKFKEKISESKL
ncbi:GLRX4 [Enterospora canceri]|uniref:GLRX4 n=1 Tax=Enterospora canceri TaxID=1081671 RepID=A0A1Y1S880_9MICR|nr:GLRX4 [Enterospora canceri]